jgi:hypothetical protein
VPRLAAVALAAAMVAASCFGGEDDEGAIATDARSYVTVSEGANPAIHEFRLPED